jgi:hypothetical protein
VKGSILDDKFKIVVTQLVIERTLAPGADAFMILS